MAVKEVAVTFDPPNKIVAKPDHVKVDWGKGETVRWSLTSSDKGAVLHGIVFADEAPLPEIKRDPQNPKVWNGGKCKEITGTFKYDIVVRDSNGREVVLDPLLGMGNPPP